MTDPLLIETATRAFRQTVTPAVIAAAENTGWAAQAWDVAADIGLPWISVAESAGGAGGSISDAVAVLHVAGSLAVPLPLAETGLLAGWLLSVAGLEVGDRPATVVPPRASEGLRLQDGRLWGRADRVPWARIAGRVIALVDKQIVVIAGPPTGVQPATNLAGEPRDTITFDGVIPEAVVAAPTGVDTGSLWARGALSRVALMAGALLAVADLTVKYAGERHQFGKPIGRFQAVQAHLVACAEEAALVDLAAQVAAREADRGPARFEIAAAKILADQAARTVPRAAHQAHGAIGVTREYPLQYLTRRLWSWRAEYGDAAVVTLLGHAVAAHPPAELYQIVANGSASGIAF